MSNARWAWALSLGVMVIALTACQPTVSGCTAEGCSANETCNSESGQCEPLRQCGTAADCSPGQACQGGTCASCTTNVRCTADLTTCNAVTNDCAACVADANCGGAFPYCVREGCASCRTDADCGGGTPRCVNRWCVQCKADGDCPSGTACKSGTCASACTSDSQCGPAAPFCNQGACLRCRTEQHCPAGEACYEGTCRAVLPGDSCRAAIDLPLAAGNTLIKGRVSYVWHADSQKADVREFSDVFYRVTVTEELSLNADLTLTGTLPEGDVKIYRGECGALFRLGFDTASIKDLVLLPGTYYVVVSVRPVLTGPYTLRLQASPVSRAVGNHCDKPQPLTVGAPGGSTQTVQATTAGLFPVVPDFCDENGTARPDAVYTFELQERSNVAVDLTPLEPSGDFTLTVVQDCYTRQQTCGGDSAPGRVRTWESGPLEPGRYFVHVRTLAAPGPYKLRVTTIPWARNSTCQAAVPLSITDGVLSTSGDARYTDSGYLGCSTTSARRLTYTFSTRGLGERSMVVELTGEQGRQHPSVSIATACLSPENAGQVCKDYATYQEIPGRMEVPFLPEGDYSLQVIGTGYLSTATGPFNLRAVLGPAYPLPANDTCSGATVVSPVSGTFQVNGDTRGATHHQSARCNGTYSPLMGRDVVYRIPISGRGRLEATVKPTTPGYDATLNMDLGCNLSSSYCSDAQGVGGEERMARRLNDAYDEDVFLWVDGQGGTEGAFTLSGRWVPAPAHDTCAGAQVLTVGTAVSGTLEAAFVDSGAGPCSLPFAPDLFYTFTAPSNGTATVTLRPSGFDGVLSAQTPCSTPVWQDVCHGTVNAGGVDAVETVSFPVQRNTPYVVVVSGESPESDGTFSLSVAIQ